MSGSTDESTAATGLDPTFGTSLKNVIVDAGLEVLRRDGFRLQEETITYANVFRFLQEEYDVTVTRGSVHERIWASQDDFRFDVLKELISSSALRDIRTLEAAAVSFAELPPHLDNQQRLVELARLVGIRCLEDYLAETMSREFVGWQSVMASRTEDEQEVLRELNHERSQIGLRAWRAAGIDFLEEFGLRPRAILGLDRDRSATVAALLIGSALSGLCIDHPAGLDHSEQKVLLPSGPNETAEWTLLGLLIRAVIDLLFEPADASPDGELGAEPNFLAYVESASRPADFDGPKDGGTTRRDRTALRELVLSAAVQMARRDGLGLMPRAVSYKTAFDVVKEKHGFVVNRSSVHNRMWPSHEAFRLEVLTRTVSQIPSGDFDDLFDAYRQLPTAMNPDGSVNERQRVLDNIRAGCQAHSRRHLTKQEHLKWFSLKAALTGQAGGAALGVDELNKILSGPQKALTQRWIDHFDEPFKLRGLKAKPELGLGWNRSIQLTAMLVTTCSLVVDFEVLGGLEGLNTTYDLPRIDGTGTTDAWSVKALGQRAIVEFFFDLPD